VVRRKASGVLEEGVGYLLFTGSYSRLQSDLWRMIQGKTFGKAYYTIEHGTETAILRMPEKEKFRLSVRKRIYNDMRLFFLGRIAINKGAVWKTKEDIEAFFNKEIVTRFAWICDEAVADRKKEERPIRFRKLSVAEQKVNRSLKTGQGV
jgi:hypothetical protein